MQVSVFVKGLKADDDFCKDFGGFADREDFVLESGLVIDEVSTITVLK